MPIKIPLQVLKIKTTNKLVMTCYKNIHINTFCLKVFTILRIILYRNTQILELNVKKTNKGISRGRGN